jgi:hypothetical protein
MSKQTAVEWLVEKIQQAKPSFKFDALIRQAKAMENEQHGNTWDAAIQAHEDRGHVIARSLTDFDEYYNETYGGDK